ncbi:hypothetical protein ACWD3J_14160 [Streptomyces sp. NPDC002755]
MTGRALVDIPAEEIVRYGPETVIEWLMARNEQHCTRLRAACEALRADLAVSEQALQRLSAALTTPSA